MVDKNAREEGEKITWGELGSGGNVYAVDSSVVVFAARTTAVLSVQYPDGERLLP